MPGVQGCLIVQPVADPRFLAGLDVGGTFTDLTLYDRSSGETRAFKVPSNRHAPDEAVVAALDKSGVPREDVALSPA